MRHQRPSLALLLLIAGVLLSATAGTVRAQVSEYGFIQNCPEGCRDIDKQTTCGSTANTASCDMKDNGDIFMQCTSGDTYNLTVLGCNGGEIPPNTGTGTTSPSYQQEVSGVYDYFKLHTKRCEKKIVSLLRANPLARSVVCCVLGALLGLIGFAAPFIVRVLPGLVFGFAFFFVVSSFFLVTEDDNQFIPLAVGITGAILIALLTAVKMRWIPFFCGTSFGFIGCVWTIAVLGIYSPSLDLGVLTPACAFISSVFVMGAVGQCFPYSMVVLTLSVEGSLFSSYGIYQLWKGEDQVLTETMGLVLLGGTFVIFLVEQILFAVKHKNDLAKKKIRDDLRRRGLSDPEDYERRDLNRNTGGARQQYGTADDDDPLLR